ncbi:TAXI family TRAP transporter solute-binding subunit [Salinibacillus xinjiangensis]|uniref:TAXI family TRAP transporter solute-binding subunit n=1 Tax=Salinibacillus xinjiangensis TaxID=1229268 RepID=A0A6G1X5U4_9BACI|nr:TAXI family TRAP transporter solute-binding subunit [Salinibacillus xinjiangensis]MRG86371.1 TAXI family TRAP transporter solute-binding subunit [Salinibacillus xinjiangensis]
MKKTITVALFSIIALVLTACGGGGTKNVAIGPAGSGTQAATKVILEGAGLEEGEHYEAYEEGFGNAKDGLQDGNIDLSFGLLGLPAGSVNDLQATAGDAKLVSLSDETISYVEENLGYMEYTIPAGTYDFQEEDVKTVTAYAVLVGNTDTIDNELAYELARISVEHADENTHAQSAHATIENALNGSQGLPIHPGAKKYYEEQGLTVESEEAEVSATADSRKEELVLGTGSAGGTYYPLGGEMATLWSNYIDGVNVTATETGASVENLATIGEGSMDLGMTVHVPAQDAYNGEGEFEGAPVENFAFIGHIYPEVMQIITREETGITNLEDLKE